MVKAGLAEVLPCDNAIKIVFLRALLPDQLPQAVVRPYHLTAEEDVDMLFQRREVGIMAGIQLGQFGIQGVEFLGIQSLRIDHLRLLVHQKKGTPLVTDVIVPNEEWGHILHKSLVAGMQENEDGCMIDVAHGVHQGTLAVVRTAPAGALLKAVCRAVEAAPLPKGVVIG